jgi:hypothetical protein
MESKIYNTTITIEGVELKNNKLTLLAHDRTRYGFWMTKKDSTDLAPYSQFKGIDLKQGDNVYIGYVLEHYTDARGVNREALKIINFRETNERPTQTAPQPQSPRISQNSASGSGSNDAFDGRLAIHGMVNARLVNHDIVKVLSESGELMMLEEEIDDFLNSSP